MDPPSETGADSPGWQKIALAQPRANGCGTVFVISRPGPAVSGTANRQTVHSLWRGRVRWVRSVSSRPQPRPPCRKECANGALIIGTPRAGGCGRRSGVFFYTVPEFYTPGRKSAAHVLRPLYIAYRGCRAARSAAAFRGTAAGDRMAPFILHIKGGSAGWAVDAPSVIRHPLYCHIKGVRGTRRGAVVQPRFGTSEGHG